MDQTGDLAEYHPEIVKGDEFAARVVDQMYDLFIFPELERRGLPAERSAVRTALVTLPPGADVDVALNDEAELAFHATSTGAIEAGKVITIDAIDPATVAGLRPVSVDPDAGWVALAELPGIGLIVAFDFTRNRGQARRLLDKADSFEQQSGNALSAGRVSPALDLAFSAAELAVTAMSLLFEEPVAGRNRHGRRLAWFSRWTRHGNSPPEFQSLLGRLSSLRPAARYGDHDPLSAQEVSPLLEEVRALIEHARGRVGEPLDELAFVPTQGAPG
jgi:hypothetical protein